MKKVFKSSPNVSIESNEEFVAQMDKLNKASDWKFVQDCANVVAWYSKIENEFIRIEAVRSLNDTYDIRVGYSEFQHLVLNYIVKNSFPNNVLGFTSFVTALSSWIAYDKSIAKFRLDSQIELNKKSRLKCPIAKAINELVVDGLQSCDKCVCH